MIDYELCYCYGIITDREHVDKIQATVEPCEGFDDFWDDNIRAVNAWTGEKYFIGYYNHIEDIAESEELISDTDFGIFSKDFDIFSKDETFKNESLEVEQFIKNNSIDKIINWKPRKFIICFIY